MLETYKILGSALALDSFTITELSDYSQVKENTVRTIIGRHQNYFTKGKQKITSKKGGQPWIYKVAPESLDELREKVGGVFEQLKPKIGITPEPKHIPSLPLGLLVAKNILGKIIPSQKGKSDSNPTDKISELIELARMNLNNAKYEYENSLQDKTDMLENEVQVYVTTIERLLTLLEAEAVFEEGNVKPNINIPELHLSLANSTQEMWNLGEHNREFAFNIMQRTAHSPLINHSLTW